MSTTTPQTLELTKVTDRVYTFRWTWDRSIVILTDEGVVVFDPFNREAAKILAADLERIAPGKPVRFSCGTA